MAPKNKCTLLSILIVFLLGSVTSCNKITADHWFDFIPQSTFFVVIPEANSTIENVLGNPVMPMLDDITPSVMQLVTTIQSHSEEQILVDALVLHPSSSDDWEPVWITQTVDGLPQTLAQTYQREFEQNQYQFKDFTIEKLFLGERTIFMVNLGEWTLFSESSFAIENMLRTLTGAEEKMQLRDEQITPGALVVNTEAMDLWVEQLSQASFRPFLQHVFDGTSPISFQQNPTESKEWQWQLQGTMQLQDSTSNLVTYLSEPTTEFRLERFIPVNAAGFSIMHTDQDILIDTEDFDAQKELDRHLQTNPIGWHTIEQNLRNEVAFVSFANSGPSSSSEYLFLRSVNDAASIQSVLDNLADQELVIKDENTYFINSYLLGKLLGSKIFLLQDFYVTVYNNVLAIAQRKGLAESVGGDNARRRVMAYNDSYSSIRNSLPSPLSSIHFFDAASFGNYIQPWLSPQNYLSSLLGYFDHFVITTRWEPGTNSVDVRLTSFQRETEEYPFTEQWLFPLNGAEINGAPVLADLTGSIRNEVIFSTENGYVYALATDGTVILQASTGEDEPVGSPVVYDWYGNNQNVILQAAGNKIFAWNHSGTLLPNFPISLSEDITTPLTIADITGNGIAEIIVATADRNMHILNARGQAIGGWPQSTNAAITSKPLIAEIDNQNSIFAFSENALHSWNVNGQRRNNYPVFLTTQMQGSPSPYENHLLGSGLDGHLYSVGLTPLFADSLSNLVSSDSLTVQTLPVSNSSLNISPSHHEILMTTSGDNFERRTLLLLQASNGSIFLYDDTGQLHFTESMGQPSSSKYSPKVLDINSDQRDDIVALADFGRLYAWDILSGERHNELPTAGMNYPVISDFTGNGKQEIIAQTREGLQCWTINYTVRESTEAGETD